MIRELQPDDIQEAYKIWNKHFKEQFDFPDFLKEFQCVFTIINEDTDKIIAVAGIKPILESIIVVDQDFSPRKRRYALFEILHASEYMGRKLGYDALHAFIQDETYLKQLLRCGFQLTKGKSVVREI